MKRFSLFAVIMFVIAGISGGVSVGLAAFADHGLANMVADGASAVGLFKEATAFQMNHALAVILATVLSERVGPGRAQSVFRGAAGLLALGAILFPTALYSRVFGGPVFWAPWGGIAAMVGWASFAVAALFSLRERGAA